MFDLQIRKQQKQSETEYLIQGLPNIHKKIILKK